MSTEPAHWPQTLILETRSFTHSELPNLARPFEQSARDLPVSLSPALGL